MHLILPRHAAICGFRSFQLRALILILGCLFAAGADVLAQTTNEARIWKRHGITPTLAPALIRRVEPEHGELFDLDAAALRAAVQKAPFGESTAALGRGAEIELPMPDGTTARFAIVESPVMAPELAARYPGIRTYAGKGMDDPTATVRFDVTPLGFHAQILSPRGSVYVDPAFRGNTNVCISYRKQDLLKQSPFACRVSGGSSSVANPAAIGTSAARPLSGPQLRTYRLALAATGEYTEFFGGTVELGMAGIVVAVNRVNGIYEQELAIRLVLVANNDSLVFIDKDSDPYSNEDESVMLDQNQDTIDGTLGSGSYDIGHVFGTGGGGIATLGSVCEDGLKARGATGHPNPTGDAFFIDYVAHEMGHQFGANHTFNSTTGSCGGGNREAAVAYEPGSGSTIMAYAGICSPNNLQSHSDPYFHAGSLNEIFTYLSGAGGGCAAISATGNGAPVANAGPNYSIPANTPFVLTASATDPEGDSLTYCWEEMDTGPAAALSAADNGSSPLFRSLPPVSSAIRYFPRLESVLAKTNWNQEKLPTTSRTMNFRVTVRDNRFGGGGVADDDMQVTVVGSTGPFAVTSPNSAVVWGGSQTVTWNVAGTTGNPISASAVNIHLSTDGGVTFPFLLATNVPNNGSRVVTLPNISTTQARIRVKPVANIFYDISDVNFTIVPSGPFIQLTGTVLTEESCLPANGVIDPYETVALNWTLSNVGTAATTNLIATLLETNGVYYPSAAQVCGAIPPGGSVSRSFSFIPSGTCGGSVTAMLKLTDNGSDLGTVAKDLSLGALQSSVVTQVFNSATTISIPALGIGSPYPSVVPVSGVVGTVVKVTVSLNGFSHDWPEDIGVLLTGPSGQGVKLMDAASGGQAVSDLSLTFDDAASSSLPATNALTSGTFLPTDFVPEGGLTAPAPQPPYNTTLNSLAGTPNGNWSLYVEDFNDVDGGSIAGWTLRLVSSNGIAVCCTTFPAPAFTSTTFSSNQVQLEWQAIPGPHYQVQYRTNLTDGTWQNLGAPILGTNRLMTVSHAVSNSPALFYQVIVQP